MKYEKPIVRDLTVRSATGGPPLQLWNCSDGDNPGINCSPNGVSYGIQCTGGGTLGGCSTGVAF